MVLPFPPCPFCPPYVQVMVFTFVLTAFFNTELGLEFGILASIVVLVWQISSLDVAAVRAHAASLYASHMYSNNKMCRLRRTGTVRGV